MTVVAAFIVPKSRRAYIGTDDLELPNNARTDKITLVDRRFAVACYGSNVGSQAVRAVTHFEPGMELPNGARVEAASNARELLNRIEVVLPLIAKRCHEMVEEFRRSPKGQQHYGVKGPGAKSTLIVL